MLPAKNFLLPDTSAPIFAVKMSKKICLFMAYNGLIKFREGTVFCFCKLSNSRPVHLTNCLTEAKCYMGNNNTVRQQTYLFVTGHYQVVYLYVCSPGTNIDVNFVVEWLSNVAVMIITRPWLKNFAYVIQRFIDKGLWFVCICSFDYLQHGIDNRLFF